MKALNKKTIFNIAIMLLAYAAVFALISGAVIILGRESKQQTLEELEDSLG